MFRLFIFAIQFFFHFSPVNNRPVKYTGNRLTYIPTILKHFSLSADKLVTKCKSPHVEIPVSCNPDCRYRVAGVWAGGGGGGVVVVILPGRVIPVT